MRQPATEVGRTHPMSVMPVVRSSDAASGTVTRSLTPSNEQGAAVPARGRPGRAAHGSVVSSSRQVGDARAALRERVRRDEAGIGGGGRERRRVRGRRRAGHDLVRPPTAVAPAGEVVRHAADRGRDGRRDGQARALDHVERVRRSDGLGAERQLGARRRGLHRDRHRERVEPAGDGARQAVAVGRGELELEVRRVLVHRARRTSRRGPVRLCTTCVWQLVLWRLQCCRLIRQRQRPCP